jgi:hypothetical protein
MRAATFNPRKLISAFNPLRTGTMSTSTESTAANPSKAFFRQPFYAKDGKTILPHYVAHRGFNKIYPENTLGAFQAAIDVGCHGIETDVQISRDGVVVISHVFLSSLLFFIILHSLKRMSGADTKYRMRRSPGVSGLIRKSMNATGSI